LLSCVLSCVGQDAVDRDVTDTGRVEPNRGLRCLGDMYSLTEDAGLHRLDGLVHAAADAETFEDLYRRCRPGLVRLAHLLTGSAAAAEDVVHDAFIGLARNVARVNDPGAYLRRSGVNLSTNLHRRATRERRHLATVSEPVVDAAEIDDTWRLLAELPPRQRAVLVLRFYLDLSEAETARVMGCRPGTVKSTTARALASLKEKMS
jgi:RNA polymerase sigma factor (sigma-70 family)